MKGRSRFRRINQSTPAALSFSDEFALRLLTLLVGMMWLDFIQNGSEVEATLPNDVVRFLAGWYLLFALVDDIPSIGKMVRITPTPVPPLRVPTVSITSTDPTASESGPNTASFTATRTGVTNAP